MISLDMTLVRSVAQMKGLQLVGAGVFGSVGGYFVATKVLEKKYQALAEEEIEQVRVYYSKISKPETPMEMVEKSDIGQLSIDFKGPSEFEVPAMVKVIEEESYSSRATRNVFSESQPEEQDQEELDKPEADDPTPEHDFVLLREEGQATKTPYIVTEEEYLANDNEWSQTTITYFAEDDVLADERGVPIPDIDSVVGEKNMGCFGWGTRDKHIVHIRNERLETEFEVLLSEGSFAAEVAGFLKHEDTRGTRKFRRWDD